MMIATEGGAGERALGGAPPSIPSCRVSCAVAWPGAAAGAQGQLGHAAQCLEHIAGQAGHGFALTHAASLLSWIAVCCCLAARSLIGLLLLLLVVVSGKKEAGAQSPPAAEVGWGWRPQGGGAERAAFSLGLVQPTPAPVALCEALHIRRGGWPRASGQAFCVCQPFGPGGPAGLLLYCSGRPNTIMCPPSARAVKQWCFVAATGRCRGASSSARRSCRRWCCWSWAPLLCATSGPSQCPAGGRWVGPWAKQRVRCSQAVHMHAAGLACMLACSGWCCPPTRSSCGLARDVK